MNCFMSMNAMWLDALRACAGGEPMDSRDGGCREVVGWSGKLTTGSQTVTTIADRKFCPAYASAELLWYLSGRGDVGPLLPYAPSYAKFADEHGFANGAYGARMADFHDGYSAGRTQLLTMIQLLKRRSPTRQAILQLWSPDDLNLAVEGGCPDLPCTIALQFFNRGEWLHAAAFMRSNDVWLGMPYDVYCFAAIQRIVAAMVGLRAGSYVHMVGSMHRYDRNAKPVGVHGDRTDFAFEHDRTARLTTIDVFRFVDAWCELPGMKSAEEVEKMLAGFPLGLLRDSVAACAAKLHPGFDPLKLSWENPALLRTVLRKREEWKHAGG